MVRKLVVPLGILLALSAALKLIVLSAFSPADTAKRLYSSPEKGTQAFVIDGVEVSLPIDKIDGAFAQEKIMALMTDGQAKVSMMRLPTQEEVSEFQKQIKLPPPNFPEKIKERVEGFFLRDYGLLDRHPEQIDHLNLPLPCRITWTSNPFSDVRTVVSMILFRVEGSTDQLYPVENAYMRGYHARIRQESSTEMQDVYTLGMKDGTGHIHVSAPHSIMGLMTPLLSSIRMVRVPADFSEQAFQKSRRLAKSAASDPAKQKLAFLAAVEAASNSPPKLEYITQVLELSHRLGLLRNSQAWMYYVLRYFPAARKQVVARFPELATLR